MLRYYCKFLHVVFLIPSMIEDRYLVAKDGLALNGVKYASLWDLTGHSSEKVF